MHRNCTLKINENDRVLEIGGGGNPHPFSSVLVDKFLDEPCAIRQRGGKDIIIDRPFIKADACLLPLKDDSFDYVIASHVVEHIPVNSIEEFFLEINRVAKAGYIEAPSLLFECLLDIPEHIWIVACKEDVVHLYKKRNEDISPLKKFFLPMFRTDKAFWKWNISRYDDLWLTGFEWSASVKYTIHNSIDEILNLYEEKQIVDYIARICKQPVESSKRAVLRKILKVKTSLEQKYKHILNNSKISTANKPKMKWRDIVVCPHCKSELKEKNNALVCNACNRKYEILEGDIPSFVDEVDSEC